MWPCIIRFAASFESHLSNIITKLSARWSTRNLPIVFFFFFCFFNTTREYNFINFHRAFRYVKIRRTTVPRNLDSEERGGGGGVCACGERGRVREKTIWQNYIGKSPTSQRISRCLRERIWRAIYRSTWHDAHGNVKWSLEWNLRYSRFELTYVSLLKGKLFQTNPNVGIPLNSHCLRERPGSYIVGRMDICAIDNAFLGKPGLWR